MDTLLRPATTGAVRQIIAMGLILTLAVLGCCSFNAASAREPLYAGGPSSLNYRRPVEDRVIDLPEDGDMWHLIVVSDASASATQLQKAMADAPRLANLATQVKLHAYPAAHWWVKKYLGGESLPLVMLTTEMGQSVYKASGPNMPANAEDLADELESAIWAYDCPDCTPSPTRPNSRIPDMRGPTPPGGGAAIDNTTLLLLGLTAAAGVAAFFAMRNQPPTS